MSTCMVVRTHSTHVWMLGQSPLSMYIMAIDTFTKLVYTPRMMFGLWMFGCEHTPNIWMLASVPTVYNVAMHAHLQNLPMIIINFVYTPCSHTATVTHKHYTNTSLHMHYMHAKYIVQDCTCTQASTIHCLQCNVSFVEMAIDAGVLYLVPELLLTIITSSIPCI